MAYDDGFKSNVLRKLRQRNESERKPYEDVIHLTRNLYESLDYHQKENVRLKAKATGFEKDIIELDLNSESGSSKPIERLSAEKKLLLLQDEFTDLLKQKGELAQQIITLKKDLEEKNKELAQKNTQIKELEISLSTTQEVLKCLQQKLSEADHNFQFLKDEYDALLITFSSVEKKQKELESENEDLISRFIEMKADDADRLNAETEFFQRTKEAKLKKKLEKAAKKPLFVDKCRSKSEIINLEHSWSNTSVCFGAALPKKIQHKFNAHDGEVNSIAWTRRDFKFATAGGDRKVKLWDFVAGQAFLRGVADQCNSSVNSVDFDSTECLLLAASSDFACRVWILNDMKLKHTFTGHVKKVMSAKFLDTSGNIISGSHDRTVRIWDSQKEACTRVISSESGINDIAILDWSGTNIASGHFDHRIRFWDRRMQPSTNEILLQGKLTSLDVSVDGSSLLSCCRDNVLNLIDIRMNQNVRTFSADGFRIGSDWTRAKFSPDDQFCICGSQNGSIYIWRTDTGNVEKVLKGHSSTVIACAWSWCGNYVVSCDKNREAVIWSGF